MDISELNFEEQMEVSDVNRVEGEEYLAESAVWATGMERREVAFRDMQIILNGKPQSPWDEASLVHGQSKRMIYCQSRFRAYP